MYPGTSGLQLYPLWARSHALSSPHTRTSKKGAQAHRGICVTGYTHFFSAGARSCCQFGEKRRGAPGVWPLLSSPLLDSSQFSSPLVSQSCYPPHDSSSLISFSTSTQPPCSLASRLNAECSGVPLSVLRFFRVTSTSHMQPLFLLRHPTQLFLAALLHLHKWARASSNLTGILLCAVHHPLES